MLLSQWIDTMAFFSNLEITDCVGVSRVSSLKSQVSSQADVNREKQENLAAAFLRQLLVGGGGGPPSPCCPPCNLITATNLPLTKFFVVGFQRKEQYTSEFSLSTAIASKSDPNKPEGW
jgi:hypothetical protein